MAELHPFCRLGDLAGDLEIVVSGRGWQGIMASASLGLSSRRRDCLMPGSRGILRQDHRQGHPRLERKPE